MTPLGIELMLDPRGLPDRPNGGAELDTLVRGFDAFLQDALTPSPDQHRSERSDVSVRGDQIDLRGNAATFDWHGVLILRTLQTAEPIEADVQSVQPTMPETEARITPLAPADLAVAPLPAQQSPETVSTQMIDPVDRITMRVVDAPVQAGRPIPSVRPDPPQAMKSEPSRSELSRSSSVVMPTALHTAGATQSGSAVSSERPAIPVMQTARSTPNTPVPSFRSNGPSTGAAPTRPEPMAGQTFEPRISMTRGETGLIIHVAAALLSPEGEKRLRERLTHIVREAGEVIETLTITMTGQPGSGVARQDTVTRKEAYHGSH
ncbi:MAG: hypothetical protein AAF926_00130 [Pseudomonadota bacterium]